jgi:hypothetical protein
MFEQHRRLRPAKRYRSARRLPPHEATALQSLGEHAIHDQNGRYFPPVRVGPRPPAWRNVSSRTLPTVVSTFFRALVGGGLIRSLKQLPLQEVD